jgi:hypothetical protein
MKGATLGSKACVLAAGLCLLAAIPALPQAATSKTSKTAEAAKAKQAVSTVEKKPKLAEITRASTEEAARSAARQKAAPEEDASNVATDKTPEPAVVELKPTTKSSEASHGSVTLDDSNGSKASRVHGRMYGSLDPKSSGDRQEGAAVGAGSKSGKTNIYVETERSRGTTPPNR